MRCLRSGDEALLSMPNIIRDIPQNEEENATTTYKKGFVCFGFEPAGSSYGGIDSTSDSCEIAWIYGDAAEASYWLSTHGPPHTKPPFYRQVAALNVFAIIEKESGFYEVR